jgi:hypothetical protein
MSVVGHRIPIKLAGWMARLWIAGVVVASLLPGSAKAEFGTPASGRAHAVQHPRLEHRLVHVFAFGSSCFLLTLLAMNRREQLQAAGEVLLVGCLVELAQDVMYSHGKIFEWWDVRDDAIGIALAFLAIQLIHRFTSDAASGPQHDVVEGRS